MTPAPGQMQQGRYRSGMGAGQPPQRGVVQPGGPAGIPPMGSQIRGGYAPDQGPNDPVQGRMPPPWMPTPPGGPGQPVPVGATSGTAANAPAVNALSAAMPSAPGANDMQNAAQPDGRMPPPWQQPAQSSADRPGYSGIGGGPGQRAATSGPQQPASPMSVRQQTQNQQNQKNAAF